MDFRVILLLNGQYKKTLHKCKTRETAFINYHRIKDDNVVYYPKRFINSRGIKPAKYEIAITKVTEDGDTFRILRNDLGKLYTESPLGDWTVITSEPFDIEETFWLYGLEKETDRVTIREVLKRLMVNAHSKRIVKQVIVVYNKLIIYNEEQFDMVVCKNLVEAQRLHHTLAKITQKQKIKSLLFMGTASKATITRLYDLIHEETGWKYSKIRRTTTGH
jgi:hypothetical protein